MTLSVIIAVVAAVLIGSGTGSAPLALLAAVGLFLLLRRLDGLARTVEALQRDVEALRRTPGHGTAPEAPVAAPPADEATSSVAAPVAVETQAPPPPVPAIPPAPRNPPANVADATARASAATAAATWHETAAPAGPGVAEHVLGTARRWFTEGNVPVKIGMLVLFAGIAALLKLAADQGWFTLPVELRLAGIALAAIGGLAFGWRQRAARRSFALSVQGGAIGVLLMTVFAAFRVYPLLSPGAAFALLLVLVAGAGALAVLQDAIALAVLAILAGFAAPILVSTGSGDHVVLFAYYALLNLAIFAIAWRRSWRALNLLGFVFTYAIATAWGVLRYRGELFDGTEPFLLLYFAIYLAIPILHAHRAELQRRDLVDGTLVFGNPLVAFALQAALLEGQRLPLAYSALAVAAVHAVLAWWLRRGARVLGEAFAVVAVGFATLAVPLALSARATACVFALEGAGLIWLGLRQQRRLPQFCGLALQALAAGAFVLGLLDHPQHDAIAFANGRFAGAVLIAVAAFASAWLYSRATAARAPLALALHLWGMLWWLAAGASEIERSLSAALQPSAQFAFVGFTALLAALALRHVPRPALAWTVALLVAAGLVLVPPMSVAPARPYAPPALAALALYAACGAFSLRRLRDGEAMALRVAHLGWLWTWTAAAAFVLSRLAADAGLAEGWREALAALPLIVAFAIALSRPNWLAPPLGARFDAHRGVLLATQATVAALAFVALLSTPGGSAPLPFVPILNPTELAQLGLLACLVRWSQMSLPEIRRWSAPALALAAFAFITMATLRAVHHFAELDWGDALLRSNLTQTALTVVWSLAGVLAWIVGSWRRRRLPWLAGALLMGLVLAKLLLVDRHHLGNLFGIASFIAYGLLCTVIGYFAPAPPRAEKDAA